MKINWSSAKLYMDALTDDNKLISINKSVAANTKVIPSLIPLHKLSGYDSVLMMFGIGKSKALTAPEIPWRCRCHVIRGNTRRGNNLWPKAMDKINRARLKIDAQYEKTRLMVQKNAQNHQCSEGMKEKKSPRPTMLPTGIKIAPDEILQTTHCKCAFIKCKTKSCSCVSAELNCSEFYGCQECDN